MVASSLFVPAVRTLSVTSFGSMPSAVSVTVQPMKSLSAYRLASTTMTCPSYQVSGSRASPAESLTVTWWPLSRSVLSKAANAVPSPPSHAWVFSHVTVAPSA